MRLCEPWVTLKIIVRSRGAATVSVVTEGRAIRLVRQIFASKYLGRRSAAPNKFITTLTQGSQSLALGLVLTAASQLVESRRSELARSKGPPQLNRRIDRTPGCRNDGPAPPESVAHLSAYGPLSHWERAGVRERSLPKPTSSMKRSASTALSMRRSSSRPHAVAMEFDLFGETSCHWVKGGSAKGTSGWIARSRIAQSHVRPHRPFPETSRPVRSTTG